MIEDYAKHAAVWDWDGYDNTAEYEYWCDYARKFGNRVLLPMCSLGQTGAYMAQKGFRVTAFDITREMIEEGKKRYGELFRLSGKDRREGDRACAKSKTCAAFSPSAWYDFESMLQGGLCA